MNAYKLCLSYSPPVMIFGLLEPRVAASGWTLCLRCPWWGEPSTALPAGSHSRRWDRRDGRETRNPHEEGGSPRPQHWNPVLPGRGGVIL